jgi:hypothetical protein
VIGSAVSVMDMGLSSTSAPADFVRTQYARLRDTGSRSTSCLVSQRLMHDMRGNAKCRDITRCASYLLALHAGTPGKDWLAHLPLMIRQARSPVQVGCWTC